MRRSIATVCLSGTLREKLEAIAAARFDGAEIFENDLIYFNGRPREVRAIADDLGLTIALYQPFRDFEGVNEQVFRFNLERAERKFDVMQELGASMVLACSNCSANALEGEERAAEQLYELAERAARRNLFVGYEALAWGKFVRHYSQVWAIVKRANHPHLGVLLDSFHSLSLGDDPAGIADIPGDKIFFVQLADAPRMAMDVLQWSRHYRCFPGQGHFDVANFLEQILVAGYTGPISLEVFNDLFREAPARRTAIDAMQSLLFLEGQVREHIERATAANKEGTSRQAQVLERVELFDPPAAPDLRGFSFLEFAVDAESEAALGSMLQTLGFQRAGRHRSKQVSLYRQGDINMVLNAEPSSFARQFFEQHGPSICAIGLRTEDSLRALNRATALHCPRFDSRVGPNELKIPAIRVPDGSLIYFVPADLGSKGLHEIDFALDAANADLQREAGLTLVDHVALGLPQDQLDTWILFYRAVLGLKTGEALEVADPFGLVRGTSVSSDDRSVRFALNVSLSRSTMTARTVTALAGAGVHHIALACTDIFATVERLRGDGVRFVPISPNYYDDLPTRFQIDDALVDRCRGLGILFDRSADGDFFHIYTESYAERFFFEVVQRVNKYDAYGAPNAPARMASQVQKAQN